MCLSMSLSQNWRKSIPKAERLVLLVPKLQLGNPDGEALASRNWKLELPKLNSQAGAWELAKIQRVFIKHEITRR